MSNVDGEVEKKTMALMAEELEKSLFHKPIYNNSETQNVKKLKQYPIYQLLLQEIKASLQTALREQLKNMDHLLFKPPINDFNELIVLPKLETIISDERTNTVGGDRDLDELINLKQTINTKLQMTMNKTSMNLSLGLGQGLKNLGLQYAGKLKIENVTVLQSMIAISDELIAIGAKDG